MPRFAANLTMLFNEVPFLERFERAARAGFGSVEFLFPYAWPAAEVAGKLRGNRLKLVLHNLPAGDWEAGERGIACLPDRVDEFREGVARAIEYATSLGAPQLNCLAGKAPSSATSGASDEMLRKTFVANLKYAAAQLKKANLKLLIEPINTYDIPGFYLNRTAQAIAIIDEVVNDTKSDNLFLQYDIYHAQRSEGELAATLAKHIARIAHVQVADNPGRHEPGTGEINYGFLFAHLDRIGYTGFVGCEYKPAGTTESGLAWLEHARRQLRPPK
jgi:hydroxypyruvate isomerase